MYMVMLILDDINLLDDVLDGLEAIGVSGVTIIESTGINRHRIARRVGSPFMAGINRLLNDNLEGHYTLFSIVPTLDTAQACISAIEKVVGVLDEPNTGVLAAWPLSFVKGVPSQINE